MATNKRTLKKEIRMICGALAGECVIAKITIPGIDTEKLNEIIYDIADLQANAIRMISVTFPRSESSYESKKQYADERHKYFHAAFRKLKGDFNARIDQIIKEMNAALPASQKEANKKKAAK
ncbi:MAG: hypothetical protein NC339_07635 [Muribaculaceae bacterium]|nr:hypothetical protein [Muribaculaceae bacterium]